MQLGSLEAVIYTIAFLVPGFVWSATLSMMVPSRKPAQHIGFLNYLTLSCINHGLWSWALFPMFTTAFISNHPIASGGILFVEGFLSPIGLGLVTAHLQQRKWIARFLQRFGLRTIDPTLTAWDWRFIRIKPYWTVVTLKDGSQVFGLFGENSFAGDDPSNRDLYLERVYQSVGEGAYTEWAPVEDTAGILIAADQISLVEFRRLPEDYYED